ncbi:MAG: hypothetical protein ACAF41_24200 [Leptolyngbya sp. BL-A-14]
MKWKIGQRVVCDRLGHHLTDCQIRHIDIHESIIIFCPTTNTVVCGQRENLERFGWRVQSSANALK